MYAAAAVAQTFLSLASREGRSITNIQLQELVLLAHGVSLAGLDKPLINDPIRAWNFGPVIPRLYNRLRDYGLRVVPVEADLARDVALPEGDPEAMGAIVAVWRTYKDYSDEALFSLCQMDGTPWDTVWNKRGEQFQPIPDEVIKSYYRPQVTRLPVGDPA